MKKFWLLVATAVLAGAQPRYDIMSLESFGAPVNGAVFARGINSFGQVMGSYWTPSFSELRLFTYSVGTGMNDLGPAPSNLMYARGINDAGQLVAFGYPGGVSQAYRYTPGVGYESLGGVGDSEALGINNRGQVTGWATISGGEHAFRYTDGTGLENLGGASIGYGINDHGTVTGVDAGNIFVQEAGGGKIFLGPGFGRAINNNGVIAGETSLTPAGGQSFIYRNGSMQMLGNLGGPNQAWALNNNNEVVGNGYAGDQFVAFLWNEQEGILDLNTLIPANSGWQLSGAFGVNDRGQIVGDGTFNGKPAAFLLNPVPEPSTWALLLLGTGALFFLRRRKA